MKFIDEAQIFIESGNGGNGCLHFHRAKFLPKGGPDGGDGGKGGSIIFLADEGKYTLLDFRYQRKYQAQSGHKGDVNLKTGSSADDLIIPVPVGTQIYELRDEDDSEGVLIADLQEKDQEFRAAKGGRGGKGNAFFRGPSRQVPRLAQPGEAGESKWIKLVLKSMADVGLVGFPNVGKSSLVRKVSNAKPTVADYPFTTINPHLGIVRGETRDFVIADIPGLIEGAAEGAGLGIQFLKHIERVKILIFVLDAFNPLAGDTSVPKAGEQLKILQKELKKYSVELLKKPSLIFLNKLDLLPFDAQEMNGFAFKQLAGILAAEDYQELQKIENYAKKHKMPFFVGSALNGGNLQAVLRACEKYLLEMQ